MCVGDCNFKVAIESISKMFTLALDLHQNDAAVLEKIGNTASGDAFNSAVAVETATSLNPFVYAGAMATVSMISPKHDLTGKWNSILSFYNRLEGSSSSPHRLSLLSDVYGSEMATNQHNVGLAWLMRAKGRFYDDIPISVDAYTRQCSVGVSATDLALMSSSFANGGKHPVSGAQILTPVQVQKVLAVMVTSGLYEGSGKWFWQVGVPAKSGVGGGLVAVVPGKYSVAVISPPLDSVGNSVKGQAAIATLVKQTGGALLGR
jgi:glutaminase